MTSATETVFIRSRIRQVCISRSSPTIGYTRETVEKIPFALIRAVDQHSFYLLDPDPDPGGEILWGNKLKKCKEISNTKIVIIFYCIKK